MDNHMKGCTEKAFKALSMYKAVEEAKNSRSRTPKDQAVT